MRYLPSIIGAAAAALGIWNAAALHSPSLGALAMSLLFIASGFVFGTFFLPHAPRIVRTVIGILLTMAWIQIVGSIFYYLRNIDLATVSITLISLPLLMMVILKLNYRGDRAARQDDALERESRSREANEVRPSGARSDRVGERSEAPRRDAATTETEMRAHGLTRGSRSSLMASMSTIAFIIFTTLAFRLLGRAGTVESIRSPWEVVPWQFFVLFFLAAAALIVLALSRSRITVPAVLFFLFLFYGITIFVYPLGYGFDPFVHQATETYIAEHGTITPKPFFYIGQYALVTIMHKVLAFPVVFLDRLLLVRLLAIFLPVAGWLAFRNTLAVALLAILPFSIFAATTPQGLANALVLVTIFLTMSQGHAPTKNPYRDFLLVGLLGLATLLTHPIAGVPLIIFLLLWAFQRNFPIGNFRWWRVLGTIFITLIGSMTLPALFVAYSFITGAPSSLRPDALARIPTVFTELLGNIGSFENHAKPWIDFAHLYGSNISLLLIGTTLFVLVLAGRGAHRAGFEAGAGPDRQESKLLCFRHREGGFSDVESQFICDETGKPRASLQVEEPRGEKNLRRSLDFARDDTAGDSNVARGWRGAMFALILTAFIVFVNAIILLAAIDFSFLPLYEQSGYAERLLDLAKLFLLPLFLFGLVWGIERVIKKSTLIVRTGTIALFAGLLTASLYLTYPHHDAYVIERGWSVGQADIEAVRSVDRDARGAPFIVLANQAVSAAALREFGFKQYFKFSPPPLEGKREGVDSSIQTFYYPIPTGGPLYPYFLRMSYEAPARATITEAMDRAGIRLGYFVVNRYWWKSDKIIERAKAEADEWWEVDGGKVFIFKFQLR